MRDKGSDAGDMRVAGVFHGQRTAPLPVCGGSAVCAVVGRATGRVSLPCDDEQGLDDDAPVADSLLCSALKKDTRYGVFLRPSFFMSVRRFGLNEKCTTLNFHTISQ